jgi:DtxR family Mn-dependent transcriptional regulator
MGASTITVMAVRKESLSALSDTAQRYLETIYYIAHEGETVRPGRVAEWMGVSAPTVTVTLQRLARDGWVEIAADRSVRLTTSGDEAAALVVRRHRLLERWLVDVLGLDWATADQEAEELSRGLSEVVLARLDEHLGHPATCPHGNEIPGRGSSRTDLVALAEMDAGSSGRIIRISEVAEHDAPQLLGTLHELGLTPGRRVTVLDRGQRVQIDRDGERVDVDAAMGRTVWLERD